MNRLLCGALALTLAATPIGAAHARLREDDAAALHKQAIGHAKNKRYDLAAEAFQAEYRISKKPELLFNIAECYRLLYNDKKSRDALREARKNYEAYVAAEPSGKMVQKARDWLGALDEELRKLGESAPAPAPAPEQPRPQPDLSVQQSPSTAAAPATTPADTGEDDTPIYKKWWLWTVVGVVAAGAVTGIVLATRPQNVEVPGRGDFPAQPFGG